MSYENYPWHKEHAEELRQAEKVYRDKRTPEQKKLVAAQERAYRTDKKDHYRALEFAREMKKYGTTVEWYRDKLVAQEGTCAICKHLSRRISTLQRLQVDHNHACCDLKTKSCGSCLRGLLCGDCNVLLSYLEKFLKEADVIPSPGSWTEKAMRYINSYKFGLVA